MNFLKRYKWFKSKENKDIIEYDNNEVLLDIEDILIDLEDDLEVNIEEEERSYIVNSKNKEYNISFSSLSKEDKYFNLDQKILNNVSSHISKLSNYMMRKIKYKLQRIKILDIHTNSISLLYDRVGNKDCIAIRYGGYITHSEDDDLYKVFRTLPERSYLNIDLDKIRMIQIVYEKI